LISAWRAAYPCVSHGGGTSVPWQLTPVMAVHVFAAAAVDAAVAVAAVAAAVVDHAHRWPSQGGDL